METKLDWSDIFIAKNLNRYRKARPTKEFWEEWRVNKDAIKAEGYSLYKENDKFHVFDWRDKVKATPEEYGAQEEAKLQIYKDEAIYIARGDGHLPEHILDEVVDEINGASDIDTIADIIDNKISIGGAWDMICQEAETLFFRLKTKSKNKK
jgi:hypothetical protein